MSFPRTGQMFAQRYRLDQVVGSGGFATVFQAFDKTGARSVALKVLHKIDGVYPAEVSSRFTREVRVVASLQDPHTVTLFDYGTSEDGFLYVVFELVGGEDLSEVLDRCQVLQERDALHIVDQILRSLREAHRVGLLHRDIKPDNIRIYEYDGDPWRAKLLDFGIARPTDNKEAQITRPGELVGTPRYMSPEQLLERPLTPASDLYSLGMVAVELLTGRDPEQGNSWTDQIARLNESHVFPVAQAAISPHVRATIQRMCARKAEDRFQSADEVLRALGAALSSDSISLDIARPRLTPSSAGHPIGEPTPADGKSPYPQAIVIVPLLLAVAVLSGLLALLLMRDVPEEPVLPPPTTRNPGLLKRSDPPPTPPPAVTAVVDTGVLVDSGTLDGGTIGCGVDVGRGLIEIRDVAGLDANSYLAYVPRSYNKDALHPAIFLFHDAAQAPEQLMVEAGFDRLAEAQGVIMLLPKDQTVFDGTGFFGRVWETTASVRRVVEMWAVAQERLCIDATRVFAVGHAAGGYAAERLACEIPIAGVATNAHIKLPTDPSCAPNPPVPYLLLLGKQDGYVPRNGGVNCAQVTKMSWADKEDRWKTRNVCEGRQKVIVDHAQGTCHTWKCDTPVVSCALEGGREWPGAGPRTWDAINKRCGGTPAAFPLVETVWAFFNTSGAGPLDAKK